jgi:hypothetical protein
MEADFLPPYRLVRFILLITAFKTDQSADAAL